MPSLQVSTFRGFRMHYLGSLVVDDIPETVAYLSKILSAARDIEVVGVSTTGLQAVAAAARLEPDLILMDIFMPEMDGLTATAIVLDRHPGVAVVMMSISGEADHLRRAMSAGASEYLVKPFTLEELLGSIRDVARRVGRKPSPP